MSKGQDELLKAALAARRTALAEAPAPTPVVKPPVVEPPVVEAMPAREEPVEVVKPVTVVKEPKRRARPTTKRTATKKARKERPAPRRRPQGKLEGFQTSDIRGDLEEEFKSVRVGEHVIVVFGPEGDLEDASNEEVIEHLSTVAKKHNLSVDVKVGARLGRFRMAAAK